MRTLKLLTVIGLLLAGATTAHSQSDGWFYEDQVADWNIKGDIGTGGGNLSCGIQKIQTHKDGTRYGFTLIQDLVDGELYALAASSEWNLGPIDSTTVFFLEFTKRGVGTIRKAVHIEVMKPHMVIIPNLKVELFLADFIKYEFMKIVPSGTAPEVVVPLKGSKAAFLSLQKCLRASAAVDPTKKKTES